MCSRIGDFNNPPFGNNTCRKYVWESNSQNGGAYKSDRESKSPKNLKTVKRNRQKRLAKLEELQMDYWNWNKHTKHHKVKYRFAMFLKLKQKSAQKQRNPSNDSNNKNKAKHARKHRNTQNRLQDEPFPLPTCWSEVRVSCTPSGNGDEKGSANKSCIPSKKNKHKRSEEALERRRKNRCSKTKFDRQQLREARKELKQVAPAQLSYTKAQDSPIATMQKDHTTTFDWKNKQDKGAGISHFLWAEEKTTTPKRG